MVGTVEAGKDISQAVALVGKYVTWYSMNEPHAGIVVAVNAIEVAASVITYLLCPSTADKSILIMHDLDMAKSPETQHPVVEAPYIRKPVNSYPVGIVKV